MGQAVKYSILGAALLVVVALIAGIISGFGTDDALSGLSGSISNFVGQASGIIQNVRGALNYVFGSLFMTLTIPFWVGVPLAYIGVKLAVGVYRWLNQ